VRQPSETNAARTARRAAERDTRGAGAALLEAAAAERRAARRTAGAAAGAFEARGMHCPLAALLSGSDSQRHAFRDQLQRLDRRLGRAPRSVTQPAPDVCAAVFAVAVRGERAEGAVWGRLADSVSLASFGASSLPTSVAGVLSALQACGVRVRNSLTGSREVSAARLAGEAPLFADVQLGRAAAHALLGAHAMPAALRPLKPEAEIFFSRHAMPWSEGDELRGAFYSSATSSSVAGISSDSPASGKCVELAVLGSHIDTGARGAYIYVVFGCKVIEFALPCLDNALLLVAGAPISSMAGYGRVVLGPGDAFLVEPGMVHEVHTPEVDSLCTAWHFRSPALALPLLRNLQEALHAPSDVASLCQLVDLLLGDTRRQEALLSLERARVLVAYETAKLEHMARLVI